MGNNSYIKPVVLTLYLVYIANKSCTVNFNNLQPWETHIIQFDQIGRHFLARISLYSFIIMPCNHILNTFIVLYRLMLRTHTTANTL